MPEAKICESDGSYYFGIPRAHGCADMVDIVTQCVEARDLYDSTTCKWSDPTTRYKFTDTENPETKIFTIRETALGNCKYSSNWRGETIECKMGGGTGTTNFTIVAVDVDWKSTEDNSHQYLIKTNTAVKLLFRAYPGNVKQNGEYVEPLLPDCLDRYRIEGDDVYQAYPYIKVGEDLRSAVGDDRWFVNGWLYKKFDTQKEYKFADLKDLYLIRRELSTDWGKDSIVFTHVPSGAKCELVYTCCALSFITPSGSPEKYKKDKDGNPIMGNGSAEPADRYVLRDKNEEKDSGEGQNEFCFSDSGKKLNVNFKVGIVPQPEGDDDYREQILNWMFAGNVTTPKETPTGIFTVQKLRSSETGTPMWSDGKSALSKKVAAKNGIFEDKVVYSGYPTNNNGFGKYTVKFELGQTKLSADYEVFFEKDGVNHPPCDKENCENCPNWFYYWKFGAVPGLAADDVIYDDSIKEDDHMGEYQSEWIKMMRLGGTGYAAAECGTIKISSLACYYDQANNIYETTKQYTLSNQSDKRSLPPSIVVGKPDCYCGVVTVAATCAHEKRHQSVFRELIWLGAKKCLPIDHEYVDADRDGVDNETETNGVLTVSRINGVIKTNEKEPWKDTYGFVAASGNDEYRENADDEIRARWAECQEDGMKYDIFKDWAKPGCQSKKPFGPKVPKAR